MPMSIFLNDDFSMMMMMLSICLSVCCQKRVGPHKNVFSQKLSNYSCGLHWRQIEVPYRLFKDFILGTLRWPWATANLVLWLTANLASYHTANCREKLHLPRNLFQR